ncbi:MAG: UDP-glucose 4-epimerase GalE [Bacteroidia bacterium]
MNILVTGGTGFIGSHTAVELLEKGYDVFIIDNLSNSHAEVVDAIQKITNKKVSFHHLDCCDFAAMDKFFAQSKIDAIIHFAALKAVGESVVKPIEYYRNNLDSLLNLLALCQKHAVKNFVFSSSCTVYGEPDYLPIDEKAPVKQPESPYGNTKKIAEDILRDTAKATDIKVISLRYFNPVGAHPTALIGEYPLGKPNNLMPVITQTAIGKIKQFSVFGTDYDTPDGSNIRDYIHVVDLALAHVIAIERQLNGKTKTKFEVFNLGTGNGISVLEMINAFETNTGIKLNYKIAARRPGDVVKVWADTTFANEELGWKATRDLKQMVLDAWRWEQTLAADVKRT